jgi:hypothetical protein
MTLVELEQIANEMTFLEFLPAKKGKNNEAVDTLWLYFYT